MKADQEKPYKTATFLTVELEKALKSLTFYFVIFILVPEGDEEMENKKTENKKTFGAYILQRRRELGMTQKELAGKLYVTESAVSKWERGMSYPDITLLQNLCSALEISEHELLSGSEDTKQRASEILAGKYLRLTRGYRIAQYIIYGTVLLSCAIGNLATSHTLDWFFIVLASLMMAASLTLVPALAAMKPKLERYKGVISISSFIVSLELLLLICCIYSGGDWFLVAAVSVLFGASLLVLPFMMPFLPLPESMRKRKISVCLMCETVLLLLLIFVCYIYFGGNWLLPMALTEDGVLFGVGLFILPVVLRQLLKDEYAFNHKALLYMAIESVLLVLVVCLSELLAGNYGIPAISLAVTFLCLALPWGIMGCLRYLPLNGWLKASVCFAWSGLWIWTGPFFIEQIIAAENDITVSYSLMLPFDFLVWDVAHTPYNVIMIILLGLGILTIVCAVMGIWSLQKKRRDG